MLVKQYAVYKNGELIGLHTAADIEKLIGCNKTSVRNYAETGSIYKQEYTFEHIGFARLERNPQMRQADLERTGSYKADWE